MHGGGNRFVNYHQKVDAQAFAVDLVKLGPDGFSYARRGAMLEDYSAFEEDILAPVAGRVSTCRDDLVDNPIGTRDLEHPEGNHIVIETDDGRKITLAHFKQRSLKAELGGWVEVGTVVGKCGNSGNSSEPHLHIQANTSNGESLTMLIDGLCVVRGDTLPAPMP